MSQADKTSKPPGRKLRALVVDDEAAIRRFLRSTLAVENFETVEADSVASTLAALPGAQFDLAVLDLGLPDGDGLDLIKPVQARGEPAIIVLSALDDEPRKVRALDAGADDFVSKPFGVAEFMARVRSSLRHRVQMQGGPAVYDDGRLMVDLSRRIVRVDGGDARLTPKEYAILQELLLHAGKVLTHHRLLEKVAGSTDGDIQALRVHVRHLRQKIEIVPDAPQLIVTEVGVGYRFSGVSD